MKNREDIRDLELMAILDVNNIVITDGCGKVLRASPSCLSIYGMEAEDLIGATVDELERRNIFSPSVTKKVLSSLPKVQLHLSPLHTESVKTEKAYSSSNL